MNVITIKALLTEVLEGAKRVAVLGCGSVLGGDDAAGMEVAERLSDLRGDARAYCGSTAPENFTGEIKRFRPDVLLVVDAADMGWKPGEVALIPTEDIAGVSFSTHMLPLRIMLDYLRVETGCQVRLIGIQGAALGFGADMTQPVSAAVDAVSNALRELLENAG